MVHKKCLLLGLFIAAAIPSQAYADAEKGKQSYQLLCASCHGNTGAADGPVGKALPPGTVTNLQQNNFKFATDDAKMTELIKKGGGAVGLSPMMPPQTGLDDAAIAALVSYIKTLKQ